MGLDKLLDFGGDFLLASHTLLYFMTVAGQWCVAVLLVTASGWVSTALPDEVTNNPVPVVLTNSNGTTPPAYTPWCTNNPAYHSYSNRLERWHDKWSSNVVGVAEYIDRFYGDNRLDDESNDTRIRLSGGILFREEGTPKYIHRINLRLQLPYTSRRLKLVFEDIVDPDEDQRSLFTAAGVNNTDANAALRYSIREKSKVRIDADVGARFSSPWQLYTRLRGTRRYDLTTKWDARLTQKITWFTDDGWVSLSEIQFNKKMGWDWLLRFNSELEWRQDRDGVRPAQQVSVFKTFSRRRSLRMDVGGSWPEYPNVDDRRYYVSLTHRRLVHSNWLFFEVKPGVEFPEEDDYDERFYLKFQFDLILGKVD
ncbi:MAG TPA: hypothetical protein PKC67_01365 [Kiritimatiellia bacterium]|nr:hypothetical protein [Kiritimatiellia bacterium]HMP32970.1 hypothetical protein [Kiritimatiellia bacterium]